MFARGALGHDSHAICFCEPCPGRFVQEIAVYDRNRKPSNWMQLIQPSQYVVFLSDAATGAEMTSDGRYPDLGDVPRCLIFDSLTDAEQFCRQRVEQIPNLRCDLFDNHGRANPPVTTFVSPLHQHRLDSPAKAQRMMRWGLAGVAASLLLFGLAWMRKGDWWLAAFFGVQMAFFGLRLLQWGYGMKEELRNRARQSSLRAQHNAQACPSAREH
jgi:hypothetical protein